MRNTSQRLLWRPLFVALAGALFCFWTTLGNELTLCVTTGCALYQDVTLGGVSLWYYGMGVFMLLSVLAVSGSGAVGLLLSGLCLLGDIGLLLLMAVTAPCFSCLTVAVFFALTYAAFRYDLRPREDRAAERPTGISWLLCLWALVWLVNVSSVMRAQIGPWALQGDMEKAGIHIYFSPSCSSCQKALKMLSGNIEAAFYPVAEKDEDVAAVARMAVLRRQGKTLYQAVQQTQQEDLSLPFWKQWLPSMVLLRFRMLRNKAHVFIAGGKAVPFFEYRGLPAHVAQKADAEELKRLRREAEEAMRGTGATPRFTPRDEGGEPARQSMGEEVLRAPAPVSTSGAASGPAHDAVSVPLQDGVAGSCGGPAPCPD